MTTALFSLVVLLFATASLVGQDETDDGPRKPTGRLAWFVATSMPDDLENPVQVLLGKDLTPVTLSRRMASGPVKIPADGLIRIVRKVPQENPDDPPYQTLAQARIPEGMSKALVILVPIKKTASGAIFGTKVQDLAKFNGGDYLYMNLSPSDVGVQLGETKLNLKPGTTKIYEAPRLTRSTNVPVSYHFFHKGHKQWRLLSASTVVLRPTRREICIFSWDPRFERISYHGVTFPVVP